MKKILCFGDSNTYGFNPLTRGRYNTETRWTGILQELCKNKYEIIEAGCNNRTAFSDNPAGIEQTGYKVLPNYLKLNPDYIIFQIGINDLQFQYNNSDIENGFEKLITLTKSISNAHIIILSAPELTTSVLKSPIFSKLFDETSIKKSKELITILEKIAQKHNCKYIELNNIKVSAIDGLHYETKEHRIIAQTIYKHLNP